MSRCSTRSANTSPALGVGLPFDPLSRATTWAATWPARCGCCVGCVAETEAVTAELAAALPPGLGSTVLGQTLAVLDALAPGSGGWRRPRRRWRWWHPAAVEPAVAMDFWFEFDDHFAFNPPPEVAAVLGQPGLDGPAAPELAASLQARDVPGGFVAAVTPIRTELEALSRHQLDVMDRHYPGDLAGLQDAFELFGQGVLFDEPRRPPSRLVHMMDSPRQPRSASAAGTP